MAKITMPPEVRDAVFARDRWCQASAYGFGSIQPCAGRLTVHHKLPRGMGGTKIDTHSLDRLVLLCDRHHTEVESYRKRAYDCGLLIRRGV